jgi:hypothetical protein
MRALRPASSPFAALAAALLLATALGASGCSSSRLVEAWQDPTYSDGALHNVLVICVKHEALRRRLWEDSFVDGLSAQKVAATPSYHSYADEAPDEAQLRKLVAEGTFDGIVLVRSAGKEDRQFYVPGQTRTVMAGVRRDFWGNYVTMYRRERTPGYVETEKAVKYETEVWALKGESRMIWSGLTETVNPTSHDQVSSEILHIILPRLQKAGIF